METFQETEQDPISSYVATVLDVNTEEILPPGSDWRWSDSVPNLNELKLMALGVSTSFLQGDSSFSTQDLGISTFLEGVAGYRRFYTTRVYYGKLFPIIARLNEFYEDDKSPKETSATTEVRRLQTLQTELNDTRKLEYPQIQWHKTLRPEADRDQLDVMQTLDEKGVPLPIRTWAAIGGFDLDQLIKDMEGDKAIRDRIKSLKPPPPPDEDGGGRFASLEGGVPRETARLSNIVNRPYAEADMELWDTTKTGKRRWVMNQSRRSRQINEKVYASLQRLSDKNHMYQTLKQAKSAGMLRDSRW